MSAVDIADFVAACQAIGRSTVSAARIRDLSLAEEGLRLDTLDSDAAALSAAAASAQDALDAAKSATGVLAQAWRSGTGSAATDFLHRQCASGGRVVAQLIAAADSLRRLWEELSRQVRTRDAANARASGAVTEPAVWLSAARAVMSGHASAEAVGVVIGRIAPFVDTVVAGDWVPTMETATAAVGAAYRQAAAELAGCEPVRFETPAMPSVAVPPAVAPTTSPEPAVASAGQPASSAPQSPPIPSIPALPTPAVPDLGVPDLGGALFPLVTAIAAALGGYSGSPTVADRAAPAVAGGATGPAAEPNKPRGEPAAKPAAAPRPEVEPQPDPQPEPGAPVALSAPPAAEVPLSPPAESPPAQPERTPCEIAADELPQVGG